MDEVVNKIEATTAEAEMIGQGLIGAIMEAIEVVDTRVATREEIGVEEIAVEVREAGSLTSLCHQLWPQDNKFLWLLTTSS